MRRLHVDRYILRDYREVAEFIADLDVCQVDGEEPTPVIWSPTAAAFIIDVASQAWAAMEAKADRYGSSAETFVSDGADRQDIGATAQLRHELHLGAAAKRVADDGLDDRPIFGSFVTNDDIDP